MICTYLSSSEVERFTAVSDPELNKLFQEVREAFPDKFLLRQIVTERKKSLFSRSVVVDVSYQLYGILSLPEVQVINFCRDWEWSINTAVPKSYIITYFYGLLVGRSLRGKNNSGVAQ